MRNCSREALRTSQPAVRMGGLPQTVEAKSFDGAVAWAFLILGGDLIIFGPFGIQVGGLNVRHALWGFVAVLSFGIGWKWRSERRQFGLLALLLGLLGLIWGVVVPVTRGVDSVSSFREFRPLLAFPVLIAAQAAVRHFGVRTLLRIFTLMSAAPALVISIAWVGRVIFGSNTISSALAQWLASSGEWRSGVFIGPMPNGEYRVMWIVVIFFPLAILASAGNRLWWLWNGIFLFASVASNTRAVFLASLLATAASIASRMRLSLTAIVVCGMLVGVPLVHFAPETRLYDLRDTLEAGDPRMEQALSLFQAWGGSPFLGLGFGGEAELVRSESARFSYEFTYLALFAKTGLVGSLLILCWAFLQMRSVIRLRPSVRTLALVAVVCFLAVTSTNPYLLNLFGVWLLMGLLAVLHGGIREARFGA